MLAIRNTPLLTLAVLNTLPWQQSHFLRLFDFYFGQRILDLQQWFASGLVLSPFLMLVAGLKAFCSQPCGWVNDHLYYIILASFVKLCWAGSLGSIGRSGA